MERRKFLATASAAGAIAAVSGATWLTAQETQGWKAGGNNAAGPNPKEAGRLSAAGLERIPVAFLISERATVIDFTGPWEVFQDVMTGTGDNHRMPFQLYTVSDKTEPITATAGLKIVPDYTFETAPAPKVVVIPAQAGRSPALLNWLRKVSQTADVTMSVCTGAFVLAAAGLLKGKTATTHHDFADRLAEQYPEIEVKRGARFIEGPKISTAGGLTSGIDLALRVVERYFGREVAQATADYMEYQSKGWIV